jgi:hypothetical protein
MISAVEEGHGPSGDELRAAAPAAGTAAGADDLAPEPQVEDGLGRAAAAGDDGRAAQGDPLQHLAPPLPRPRPERPPLPGSLQ